MSIYAIDELKHKISAYEIWLVDEEFSPQTRRAYISRIRGFKSFLSQCKAAAQAERNLTLRDLAQSFHNHLMQKTGAKQSSVNASITAVYHFYSYIGEKVPAVMRDWVLHSAPRTLNSEEQERLVKSIANQSALRDRALLTLLLYTGIRIGECRDLQIGKVEISAHTGRILVSSGKRSRSIPLNQPTRQLLLEWLIDRAKRFESEDELPLFPNKQGSFMTRTAIDEIVRKVGRAAGLNISAQVLRNCFLSALIETGSTFEAVAEIGGHAKLEHLHRFVKPKEMIPEIVVNPASPTQAFTIN